MTAKKPTTLNPTPPIRDRNHNGMLDGQDILTQLRAEEQRGDRRTPTERAHGVLEETGLRELTRTISINSLAGGGLRPGAFAGFAALTAESLRAIVAATKDALKKDPHAREHAIAEVRQLGAKQHASAAAIAIGVADANSAFDFALTFDRTFPKGIHIEARDMPHILSHFGPLLLPAPAPTPPPPPRPRGATIA